MMERHWKISSEYYFYRRGTLHKGSIMTVTFMRDNGNRYSVQLRATFYKAYLILIFNLLFE